MTRKAFRKWRDEAISEAGEKASETFVALDNMHRALSGEPLPRSVEPEPQPVIRIDHRRRAVGATFISLLPWLRQ